MSLTLTSEIIAGSPGSRIYWFGECADAGAVVTRWMSLLGTIPIPHRRFICPIIVSPIICGRIRTHGGYYSAGHVSSGTVSGDWFSLWGDSRTIEYTGVDAEFLTNLRTTNSLNRLVAVPTAKALDGLSHFTLFHELAHGINDSVRLYPEGATAADFPGVIYPRNQTSVHEVAAEAYARYILTGGRDLARNTVGGTNLALAQRAGLITSPESAQERRALDRREALQARQLGRLREDSILSRTQMLADMRSEDVAEATLMRSPAMLLLSTG